MGMFHKNLNAEARASLEFAEDARESDWSYPSFLGEIFQGNFRWDLVHPFPTQSPEDKKIGDDYCAKLEAFLREHLNPNQVDQSGKIPEHVIKGLGKLGAFAIKIPKKYGGLGLSQVNYNRALHMVSSYCCSTAVLLSAHQSIGVPQPLIIFGTEAQKEKYLPRFAKGAISAFALTEPHAGSDPRSMSTTATPTEDGRHFVINGKKLWCTNGVIADIIVVMAVTPPKMVDGKERKQITAFIVETKTPGFHVEHRCSFMGLHGIQNGVLRFDNVKVPRENIVLGEGEGLRLALTTLNTGRLTLPATSAGGAKWCLNVARRWASTRRQWGHAIGEHESIAAKLGVMTANTFAMDAVTWLTSHMADAKRTDIRLEAAAGKLFCSEQSWRVVDDTLQIRGGCGYESAMSLKTRGETDYPVERVMRDSRIILIIEGTSEIMHLFIAREALDPHMQFLKPLFDAKASWGRKIRAAFQMMGHYARWYPKLWVPSFGGGFNECPEPLRSHLLFIRRRSKKLGRCLFHKMMILQKKMATKQKTLNRFVDVGCDLFAMACACAYATALSNKDGVNKNAVDLANLFCQQARQRVEHNFHKVSKNYDQMNFHVAKHLLAGDYKWLESDIIKYDCQNGNL